MENDKKIILTKSAGSSLSELSNNSDTKNNNYYYCETCELKFGTKGWYNRHMNLGKHKEIAKCMQHRVGVLLHSSLSDQVILSSRHVRAKADFDDDDAIAIDLNRKEIKRGFARKDTERSKSVFSKHLKLHVKELFDLGVNSTTGQIEKSKKVSKHEAVKRLRIKIRRNEEGCWTAEDLLKETQVAGLFSSFLKQSKVKSMQKEIHPEATVNEELHVEIDDSNDDSNAVEHEQRLAGLTEALCEQITI